jgi:hypothetical protein
VDFHNVQDLQQFEELLRRVKTALEINEDSIRSLMALNDKLRQLSSDGDKSLWIQVDVEAEQQLAIFGRYKRNVETLLQNVHGRASLVGVSDIQVGTRADDSGCSSTMYLTSRTP